MQFCIAGLAPVAMVCSTWLVAAFLVLCGQSLQSQDPLVSSFRSHLRSRELGRLLSCREHLLTGLVMARLRSH